MSNSQLFDIQDLAMRGMQLSVCNLNNVLLCEQGDKFHFVCVLPFIFCFLIYQFNFFYDCVQLILMQNGCRYSCYWHNCWIV